MDISVKYILPLSHVNTFLKQYMLNVKMLPLNIQSKWKKEVHTEIVIEDSNVVV
jgi:hypothetical protein